MKADTWIPIMIDGIVEDKLESIFGSIRDVVSFIEGTTHWFALPDGNFMGNLGV